MRDAMDERRRARPVVAVLAGLVALLAFTAAPALGITNGSPDGDGHPYVGLMVAQDENGLPLWRCSGTLIAPDVFLTAGHCTEAPAAKAQLWFEKGPILTDPAFDPQGGATRCDGIGGYPCKGDVGGIVHTIPSYDPNAFWLHDVGVVVLDSPVELAAYGALPTVDQLDSLRVRASTTFTAVGYGLQRAFPDASAWKEVAVKARLVAYPHLIQINTGMTGPGSLLLSNNAHTGGTCFGDSGGPDFVGTSDTVAGVTSFGMNWTCGGTGGVFRVDRADVLDWIEGFLD
jgi:hypothetical protein